MASQIASIPLPETSKASVPEIDIQNAFEARVKPDLLIEKLKNDLKSADANFSQSIVREIVAPNADIQRLVELLKQFELREKQTAEQIAALEAIKLKIQSRVKDLKENFAEAVAAFLQRRIAKLVQDQSEKQSQTRATADEIKRLQEDLEDVLGPSARPVQTETRQPPPKSKA